MLLGLYNSPVTFHKCMMSIYSNMVKQMLEVFMDDFSIFWESYDDYLYNLENMLRIYEEINFIELGKVSLHGTKKDSLRP